MNPNIGDLITEDDLEQLRARDPEEAAKYSVLLQGARDDVEQIASAVRAAHRARREPHPLSMRAAAERATAATSTTQENPA